MYIMNKKDKELLIKDLCARLPYGLKCKIDLDMLLETFPEYGARLSYAATSTGIDLHAKVGERVYTLFGIPSKHRLYFLELDDFFFVFGIPVECVKPYLCPMSSMTEEEENEWWQFDEEYTIVDEQIASMDWLNSHHFDYRGLIEKGLALEAPKGMYE